jgi:FkbM family methyltransferase
LRIPDWKWILKWKILYPVRHGRFYGSDYEASVHRAIVSLSGDVFWDVGANTGYYSLRLASRFVQVRAFEPNPDAVRILKLKIARARIRNVKVEPLALADSIGTSKFYLFTRVRAKTVGSCNSLIRDSTVRGEGSLKEESITSPAIEVETTTIDTLLGAGKVDLMKIDVEGAEFMVLRGGSVALSQGRIHRLVIELHDRTRKDELESVLISSGYRTEWLDYDRGGPLSHVLATCNLGFSENNAERAPRSERS